MKYLLIIGKKEKKSKSLSRYERHFYVNSTAMYICTLKIRRCNCRPRTKEPHLYTRFKCYYTVRYLHTMYTFGYFRILTCALSTRFLIGRVNP